MSICGHTFWKSELWNARIYTFLRVLCKCCWPACLFPFSGGAHRSHESLNHMGGRHRVVGQGDMEEAGWRSRADSPEHSSLPDPGSFPYHLPVWFKGESEKRRGSPNADPEIWLLRGWELLRWGCLFPFRLMPLSSHMKTGRSTCFGFQWQDVQSCGAAPSEVVRSCAGPTPEFPIEQVWVGSEPFCHQGDADTFGPSEDHTGRATGLEPCHSKCGPQISNMNII